MPVITKICGITNREDAMAAINAGADAVGFVFWDRSPRAVTIEAAARIILELPQVVLKVGVFVDPEEALVLAAIGQAGINIAQFHGKEEPDFCNQFGIMSLKAFRIRDESSLNEMERYDTQGYLLDAYSPDAPGGTGEKFNWDIAVKAKSLGRPIFLAGGLVPENVAEAVRHVRPFAVDVSSGVERSPGVKDHEKIRAFVQAAKSVPQPEGLA